MKQTIFFCLYASLILSICPQASLAQQSNNHLTTPDTSLPLRGLGTNQSPNDIRLEALSNPGTIFLAPDKLSVQPPMLKVLIQLNDHLSPYGIDAESSTPVNLHDVIQFAINNNLDIKISQTQSQSNKWLFISSLGQFLPSMSNNINYEYLTGKFSSPFGVIVPMNSPFLTISNNLTQNLFKGGAVLFGSIEQSHKYKASKFVMKSTTSDTLFDVADRYYNLVLNDVLLQIRIKAVETAKALLDRNQTMYTNGANTKLDLLQARTQLSNDRQALINQQIARRKSAVDLAYALNLNAISDLVLKDRMVSKIRLVDANLKISDLLQIAIDNRPELKVYDHLHKAAKAAVKVARAPLMPTVSAYITGVTTGAKAAPLSQGQSLTQSGASSGALAVGSFAPAAVLPINSNSTTNNENRFNTTELLQFGIGMQWTLGGLGVIDSANTQSVHYQERKTLLEFNHEMAKVYQEVRDTYLDVIDAENLIEETTDAVNSSHEQLEVAGTRLAESVGTDLEVVNAQRSYTDALTNKANAIIKFNVSQAKLLRSIGRISLETLTSITPLKQ